MNRLASATSPYLLQHAANPVDWWPWCDEAFAESRASNRPVLLSIGYAACHWCHVMAHESFENDAIALLMNRLFVNIKVDREERPDIDHVYMSALHSLGEQGGWPLTMFLDAERRPFWGGTYFPPEGRWGRPGFPDVLSQISAIYQTEPERVARNSAAISEALVRAQDKSAEPRALKVDVARLGRQLESMVDPVHGGLRGAPKFPNAPILALAAHCAARTNSDSLRGLFLTSLRQMIRGGIHDHLGGGFARYAVDEAWLVPHFEKMLYDNAQLLELLASAYQLSPERDFAAAADGLVGWLRRDMMVGRAFASSLDADSEGEEGRFYVWSRDEVAACLGPDEAAFFGDHYDISAEGNWEGKVILNRLAARPTTPEQDDRLAALRQILFDHRSARVPPGRDDKVLADWNGLMITALCRTAPMFNRPDWVDLAAHAFRFIAESMADNEGLGHSWRAGQLSRPGFASDHAAMILAATSLAEAGVTGTLDVAECWARHALATYRDPRRGVLAMTSEATDLAIRPVVTHDDAVPNANGVMIEALIRLACLTGNDAWREEGETLLMACMVAAVESPLAHATILSAHDFAEEAAEIVVAGTSEELRAALLREARHLPFHSRIVCDATMRETWPADHPAAAQLALAGEGAAFVCVGRRCSLPIREPGQLAGTCAAMLGRA
jgi:uncharacterized protein YyaL (SSP411 family)